MSSNGRGYVSSRGRHPAVSLSRRRRWITRVERNRGCNAGGVTFMVFSRSIPEIYVFPVARQRRERVIRKDDAKEEQLRRRRRRGRNRRGRKMASRARTDPEHICLDKTDRIGCLEFAALVPFIRASHGVEGEGGRRERDSIYVLDARERKIEIERSNKAPGATSSSLSSLFLLLLRNRKCHARFRVSFMKRGEAYRPGGGL